MPFSITVKLAPITHRSGRSRLREVTGARIGLRNLGAGLSKGELDTPKPAELVFHTGYMGKARNVSAAELTPLARLAGTLSFEGKVPRPVFTFPDAPQLVIEGKLPPKDKPARQLALVFGDAHFRNAPGLDQEAARLRLPEPAKGDRFLELGVELLIDGAVESPLTANDRLDVPLRPLRVGLVLELPASLSELIPPSLTLEAKQGGIVRQLRWAQGIAEGSFRRFLFRDVLGPGPVDLTASIGARRELLWEKQVVNDPERPPTWRRTLEDFVRPALSPSTEVLAETRLIGETNDLPRPKLARPRVDPKTEQSFLV